MRTRVILLYAMLFACIAVYAIAWNISPYFYLMATFVLSPVSLLTCITVFLVSVLRQRQHNSVRSNLQVTALTFCIFVINLASLVMLKDIHV